MDLDSDESKKRSGVRTRSMKKKEKEDEQKKQKIAHLRTTPKPKSFFEKLINQSNQTTDTKASDGSPEILPFLLEPSPIERLEQPKNEQLPSDNEYPEILTHKELSVRELISVDQVLWSTSRQRVIAQITSRKREPTQIKL